MKGALEPTKIENVTFSSRWPILGADLPLHVPTNKE